MTRRLYAEALEKRRLLAAHNFDRPFDVDGDGIVTSRDVMQTAWVVVGLKTDGPQAEGEGGGAVNAAAADQLFADVNNDGRNSLSDILAVLGALSAPRPENAVQWAENGHWYAVVFDPVNQPNWHQAQELASEMVVDGRPGHLATITSQAEQDFVRSIAGPQPLPGGGSTHYAAHFGLTDSELMGGRESFDEPNPRNDGWRWVTGEPVDFTNWASPSEPDNGRNSRQPAEQDYGAFYSTNGAWRDGFGRRLAWYIVEFSGTMRV